MFTVDMTDAKRVARELQYAGKAAVAHGMRDYLNAAAFETRREWVTIIGERFQLRNTWTARSIQVRKIGAPRAGMESSVGSTAEYMAEQEEGHTNTSSGKHGLALPTGASAGQKGAKVRTKTIRRGNYLGALRVPTAARVRGGRQRRNKVAMIRAIKSGSRVAFLDLGQGRSGLFRINGSIERMRKPVMLYDLSRKSTKTPASHTLRDALIAVAPRLPDLATRAMMTQMNRAIARMK